MTILYIGITKTVDGICHSQTLMKDRAELPDDFEPATYVKENYPGWSCTGWREMESKARAQVIH